MGGRVEPTDRKAARDQALDFLFAQNFFMRSAVLPLASPDFLLASAFGFVAAFAAGFGFVVALALGFAAALGFEAGLDFDAGLVFAAGLGFDADLDLGAVLGFEAALPFRAVRFGAAFFVALGAAPSVFGAGSPLSSGFPSFRFAQYFRIRSAAFLRASGDQVLFAFLG